MIVTSVNIKPKIRVIEVNIKSPTMKEYNAGINVGMNVTSVNRKFI